MLFTTACLVTISCNKKFDEPPLYEEPNITPNATIAQLKARHSYGEFEQITGDTTIAGIVVADDRSGNYFKSVVVQDESGGILIRLDQTSLFTSYPAGRKVYIKCKGLYLGDYNGLMQLGGGVDNTNPLQPSLNYIASNLIDAHVIKGSLNNPVTPQVVSIADLTSNIQNPYQNTLIQIDDLQFAPADTSKTYADAVTKASRNFTLKDCSGLPGITLRSSGYANFAGINVPKGNGSIIAVFSVFGSAKQLNIRDTSDVQFNNTRCTAAGTLLTEDFESVSTASGNVLSLTGWQNVAEAGNVLFSGATFGGNKFAKISAFKVEQTTVKTWLVTPSINLDATSNEVLTFGTIDGFDNGATLKVYISNNYTGSATPWADGTWTLLPATISSGHGTFGNAFVSSGSIDVSSYSGNANIAFVYEGSDPGKTTTFEIDNVKVNGN